MKVVGLLSGGKDSCYNLCHCVCQGHEIVALATLCPPGSKDELDSYMYQTVGHDAVHLVAQAMQLPLYRQEIQGVALNQAAEYGSRLPDSQSQLGNEEKQEIDETEDLYQLLLTVKHHHPDIETVSVGAILSNYQRVRVEHVALRAQLSLLPLTFLWQRSQSQLFDEMIQAGMTSILIKVAGIGLDQNHLGKTLAQMRTKLFQLNSMYGAHVCGEGGEYETLTLDCPLFKKRIEIQQTETVIHSDSAFASVSYLRIKKAKLVEKQHCTSTVAVPPELDDIGQKTLVACVEQETQLPQLDQLHVNPPSCMPLTHVSQPFLYKRGRWFSISNVDGGDTSIADTLELEQQVKTAFQTIQDLLASQTPPLNLTHLSHINLHLCDQSLFPKINAVYKTLFGSGPPTRACIATSPIHQPNNNDNDNDTLPVQFKLSAIGFDDLTHSKQEVKINRKPLHVQGRSYWAPANIGPYSQGVQVGERIWIAGQIGLRPVDLSLPDSLTTQTALSLQHARRIFLAMLEARADQGKGWIEGGLCWLEQGQSSLSIAHKAWLTQFNDNDDDQDHSTWLGDNVTSRKTLPPMLFVTLPLDSLPRSAKIEWQITAHTGRKVSLSSQFHSVPSSQDLNTDDEEEEEDDGTGEADLPLLYSTCFHMSNVYSCQLNMLSCKTASSSFGLLQFNTLDKPYSTTTVIPDTLLSSLINKSFLLHLLYTPGVDVNLVKIQVLEKLDLDAQLISAIHWIPVTRLDGSSQDRESLQQIQFALVWYGI